MINQPLLSVIIPVYNTSAFLERCLNSVIYQTYMNLEIILVNDGSTDNSLDICNSFVSKDKRIKIINQANGGLSRARNAGLAIATGELITFVDSDDWIEPAMYSTLISLLFQHNAEVAGCRTRKTYPDNSTAKADSIAPSEYNEDYLVFESNDCLRSLFEMVHSDRMTHAVWDKIYRRELIQNIRFAEDYLSEDTLYTAQVMEKAQKVVVTRQVLYNWYQRDNSISHTEQYDVASKSLIYVHKYELSLLEKHGMTNLYNKLLVDYYRLLIYLFCVLNKHRPRTASYIEMLKTVRLEHKKIKDKVNLIVKSLPYIPRKDKYKYLLAKFSLKLYSLINRENKYW